MEVEHHVACGCQAKTRYKPALSVTRYRVTRYRDQCCTVQIPLHLTMLSQCFVGDGRFGSRVGLCAGHKHQGVGTFQPLMLILVCNRSASLQAALHGAMFLGRLILGRCQLCTDQYQAASVMSFVILRLEACRQERAGCWLLAPHQLGVVLFCSLRPAPPRRSEVSTDTFSSQAVFSGSVFTASVPLKFGPDTLGD